MFRKLFSTDKYSVENKYKQLENSGFVFYDLIELINTIMSKAPKTEVKYYLEPGMNGVDKNRGRLYCLLQIKEHFGESATQYSSILKRVNPKEEMLFNATLELIKADRPFLFTKSGDSSLENIKNSLLVIFPAFKKQINALQENDFTPPPQP